MPEKTKICKYCGETKALSEFDKNKTYTDGYTNKCRACHSLYDKQYRQTNAEKIKRRQTQYYRKNKNRVSKKHRQYYLKHRQKILERAANYRDANREQLKQYFRDRYADNREELLEDKKKYMEEHREEKIEYLREYYKKNKKKLLKQQYEKKKERLSSDPNFKLKEQVRLLIWRSFHQKGQVKPMRSETILGCSLDDFVEHLKRTWLEKYHTEWTGQPCHIDHIVPLVLAKTDNDVLRLCHHRNLRLLTPEDNLEKAKEDRRLAKLNTTILQKLIKEEEK